jgi:uncharacterized protein (DUF488 family)
MFADTPALGAGPISSESPSGLRSRTARSSTCGFRSLGVGAHRVLIHRTRHGAAFRGYADYMATEAFADGLARLVNLASGLRTAVLCAESLWWRCHRGLIADVLRWLNFEVIHILGPGSTAPHPYTPAARIVSGRLSYAEMT